MQDRGPPEGHDLYKGNAENPETPPKQPDVQDRNSIKGECGINSLTSSKGSCQITK